MKVCIFGSDGRTGREVVARAKSKGYEVIPFAYSEGQNVLDYGSVVQAVAQSDAVISTLGHIKGSDPLMQTKGIKNIVTAMQQHGVKRIISMTGTGVRVSGDTPSLIDRFLNFGVKLVDPERVNDGIEHVKVLEQSDLDWTVVRVLKLSKNDAEVAGYTLTEHGPAEYLTSRKKVAQVLVDLIEDEKYIKKLPVISG